MEVLTAKPLELSHEQIKAAFYIYHALLGICKQSKSFFKEPHITPEMLLARYNFSRRPTSSQELTPEDIESFLYTNNFLFHAIIENGKTVHVRYADETGCVSQNSDAMYQRTEKGGS